MFDQVSFSANCSLLRSSPRGPQLNPSIGGLGEHTLKNEYGARFVLPAASMLDTHAIGRGMMASRNTKYISSVVKSDGDNEMVLTVAWLSGAVEISVSSVKGIPINPFFGRIASLRSARNPHVPGRTFRLLCATRLALHPENSNL